MITISKKSKPTAHLIDEFVERCFRWREACEDVHSAYAFWSSALAKQRSLAFEVYRAALDREEMAASALEGAVSRLQAARS